MVISKFGVLIIFVGIILLTVFIALAVLIVRALLKYNRSKEVRNEKSEVRKSLGEVLKAHCTEHKMTQEFVAEAIGVSRQAVSKWEKGPSQIARQLEQEEVLIPSAYYESIGRKSGHKIPLNPCSWDTLLSCIFLITGNIQAVQ
ncbi:MAG: helix-turn-helix transcriptional regulator [Lachnospiraceae bacterium]|nr:helix-turn-helix transcriptional regulator [Lachnospiraceae bacterium]